MFLVDQYYSEQDKDLLYLGLSQKIIYDGFVDYQIEKVTKELQMLKQVKNGKRDKKHNLFLARYNGSYDYKEFKER